MWPGVQKALERKLRPVQMCLIVTNDGIRVVQMGQIRKREFVQADHVSSKNKFYYEYFIFCLKLYLKEQ